MRLAAFPSGRRILPAFAMLFLTVPAWGTDTPMDRATLKGITEVQVLVETIDPEVERHGLTQSQLQTDLELRLKQSGIKVVSASPASLYVDIQIMRVMVLPLYAYSLEVAFQQPVRLDRDLKISHVSAPTWSLSGSGVIMRQRVRELRSRVIEQVDQFINAYREQNPKR
jgi:hypothetical protein